MAQGLIEGKWLNRLLGTDAWGPATLGNNLFAEGPGIRTTLARIEAGLQEGQIEVSYRYQVYGEERRRVQHASLTEIAG